jgi:hypothetical protein
MKARLILSKNLKENAAHRYRRKTTVVQQFASCLIEGLPLVSTESDKQVSERFLLQRIDREELLESAKEWQSGPFFEGRLQLLFPGIEGFQSAGGIGRQVG